MHILRFPFQPFTQLLLALEADPRHTGSVRVGIERRSSDTVWLARGFSVGIGNFDLQAPVFRVALVRHPASIEPPDTGSAGDLFLGRGTLEGRAWGFVRSERGEEPLHRLDIVGPGMERLVLLQPNATSLATKDLDRPSPGDPLGLDNNRWSRTAGALGGEAVLRRLTSLRIALSGVGRTGSILASLLATLGLRDVALIDPDRIAPHNLGEMDLVTEADLGRSKAEAVLERLRNRFGHAVGGWHAVSLPLPDPVALNEIKEADVAAVSVDQDAARLAAALVAACYHKVLLDIGTGIHWLEAPSARAGARLQPRLRRMGADVRLVLPGDSCLLCLGGLAHSARAVEALCSGQALPSSDPREGAWREERAGSLRSLNEQAAAHGLTLVQELVSGRLRRSVWTRFEYDREGGLSVENRTSEPAGRDCPLCERAGAGDEAEVAGLAASSRVVGNGA